MTSIVAPRYELPVVDESGRMSREWYKFLVQLSKAVGASPTSTDDLQATQAMDSASAQGTALSALRQVREETALLMMSDDRPQSENTALLAWWPGDAK